MLGPAPLLNPEPLLSEAPVSDETPVAAPDPAFPASFADLVTLVRSRAAGLAFALENDAGLVRYAPPELELKPFRPLDVRTIATLVNDLTGQSWTISLSDGPSDASLYDQQQAGAEARREEIRATPIVAAALAAFPGAALAEPDSTN